MVSGAGEEFLDFFHAWLKEIRSQGAFGRFQGSHVSMLFLAAGMGESRPETL